LLWVDRIGLLLRSGRLGDLAEQGDGWSNLVHVDDVAEAVVLSIRSSRKGTAIYNLSAPDSPRWNSYFRDFALAADWVPLRYKSRLSMVLESNLIAPPLKIWERLSARGWLTAARIQSIPPSLLHLWSQQIRLQSAKAERELGLKWTPYDEGLKDSVDYFRAKYG
jgi:nucleoside-diphosphate-sugar epimerase